MYNLAKIRKCLNFQCNGFNKNVTIAECSGYQ